MHIHILGICGTLMGSIALLARELGYRVSGSDQNVYPPMSTQLENAGIELASPYKAKNIPDDVDLVIVGNAGLARGNPALECVLDKGLSYTSGAEWLGRYVLQDRWVIAVAGTHGKTTTATMIAWVLEYAGMNPGFLIGGVPVNFGESARAGSDPFFVIEADEYDTSYFDRRSKFLHYRPRTAVLNNLEYDHADIFPDLAAIQNQFHLLVRSIPGNGLIIHPKDESNLQEVLDQGCWTPTLTFGDGGELAARKLADDGSAFEVILQGKPLGTVKWQLTGDHNVHNALATIAAARHAGVKPTVSIEALAGFQSVKRRMEVIYQVGPVTIYDDFAHHPTAITSTLAGLRARYPGDRILAVIEPGSHTMRKGTHEATLGHSTTAADDVIWFKPDNLGWDLEALADEHHRVTADLDQIIAWSHAYAAGETRTHIVIMSNASFGGLHRRMVQHFEQG